MAKIANLPSARKINLVLITEVMADCHLVQIIGQGTKEIRRQHRMIMVWTVVKEIVVTVIVDLHRIPLIANNVSEDQFYSILKATGIRNMLLESLSPQNEGLGLRRN